MDKLDEILKSHYQQQSLSEQRMQHIERLGEQAEIERRSGISLVRALMNNLPRVARRYKSQLVTATVSVAVAVMLTSWYFAQRDVSQLVLAEVAMNHNKQLNIEFPIAQFNALQTAMSRLDFSLHRPQGLADHYELLGGRYCSIQGNLAAQLKVRDSRNHSVATLYVLPLTTRLRNVASGTTQYENVEIKLWHSDRYFYALANSRHSK